MDNRRATRVYRKRLTVELLPEDEALVRRLHSRAVARGETLRELVLRLLRREDEEGA